MAVWPCNLSKRVFYGLAWESLATQDNTMDSMEEAGQWTAASILKRECSQQMF